MKKLLIANRGEIARRVIRTAHAMGIATVAVYADPDRDALHVREASSAVALGGSAPADSYLRIDKLLDAARASGADAVHPGYGFLSENAEFAQAVVDAGLIWVGPPAAAIRAVGSKSAAKALAAANGVPSLPGYSGSDQDEASFVREAERIGYPLMVKAVAGGGGRGMRLVKAAEDLPAALQSARSEALAGFANGDLLIERALLRPRHVEVQVFADNHGHCIHLGERDCSVQRRHQKIIEEAPSPAVSPELREALGRCAVALAQAAGYVGAGTVEFLLDEGETAPSAGRDPRSGGAWGPGSRGAGPPQGEAAPSGGSDPRSGRAWGSKFYLMEMNTRLQVEHPVTEALTGLDLVEWQLRIARGEPLPMAQSGVRLEGHAVEVRLCAEDARYVPHTGTVLDFQEPLAGLGGVRFDYAIERGLVVTPFYDAMLGKLIAHAPTRREALDRLVHALEQTRVLGLQTNRGFLTACLQHPVFRLGEAGIAFLEEHGEGVREALVVQARSHAERVAALAVLYARAVPAAALPCPFARPVRLALMGRELSLSVLEIGGGHVQISDAKAETMAHVLPLADGALGLRITHDGQDWRAFAVEASPQRWHLQLSGGNLAFTLDLWLTDLSLAPQADGAGGQQVRDLRAPFNGKLMGVKVQTGQAVAKGDALLVIESMKLEHTLSAPRDAVVTEVLVEAGQQVAPGQLLLRFEAEKQT
jgi:geranyl-CoA carboxylase alpha subunit